MRGLGKGIREFNSAKDNVKKELEAGMQEKDEPVKPSANQTTPANTTSPVTATTSEANGVAHGSEVK
jgi:sec-independent protein translocase protein TatA